MSLHIKRIEQFEIYMYWNNAPNFINTAGFKGADFHQYIKMSNFKTKISPIDGSCRKKKKTSKKETLELNNVVTQTDINNHWIWHPKTGERIFILAADITFSKISHIVGHRVTNTEGWDSSLCSIWSEWTKIWPEQQEKL